MVAEIITDAEPIGTTETIQVADVKTLALVEIHSPIVADALLELLSTTQLQLFN